MIPARALAAVALAGALASCGGAAGSADAHTNVYYAWDRPERLAPLLPAGAAVAVYTATVSLRAGQLVWLPRLHPLTLPKGARRIAVIHIEPAPAAQRRPLDDALLGYLVDRIADEASRPGVVEVQLDYEAPLSERDFLKRLVIAVKPRLAPTQKLSMTALASWCLFDGAWVDALPLDDVVPMVYRMGRDRDEVRRWLDGGKDFRVARCRGSVAVSLADPPPRLPPGRRRFLFNPRSWSAADLSVSTGQ